MFVKYLAIDDFTPQSIGMPLMASGKYFDPNWNVVEEGIRNLDDDNRALVVLANKEDYFDDGGCSLGVGGGTTDGKYLCIASLNGREWWLKDPSKGNGVTRDIMFGETMTVSEQYCVELADVLIAARHFFENGSLAPNLHWVEM